MATFKKMIKLDFYAMKPLFKVMMVFLIIPLILGIIADKGTSIMVTLTFLVFMLNSVFAITEKSNFNKLYGVLPIKKDVKISSRYLFSLIVILTGAFISFMMYIILSAIFSSSIEWIAGVEYLTVSIVIAFFFISIQYPFYYKFEYSKATFMSVLPYVLCFAIGIPLIQYLMKDINFYINLMEVLKFFHNHTALLVLSGILLSTILMISSCILSIKIQKKEF